MIDFYLPQYSLPSRLESFIVFRYHFKVRKDGIAPGDMWSASVRLKNHHVISKFDIVDNSLPEFLVYFWHCQLGFSNRLLDPEPRSRWASPQDVAPLR